MGSRPRRGPAAKRAVQTAVKVAAAAADRARAPAPGVTVLIYHRVGARTPCAVDLPASRFDEQMAELAGRVVTLDEAAAQLAGRAPRPPRDPVVVTFDDGTADFVDEALPILDRHRIPVTLYVATDFVERGRPFPDEGVPVSWAGLADAVATGLVEVGSHTHTHALLDRLPVDEAASELDRSGALIEERLGRPARHFAYPKAVPPAPAVDGLVRDRYETAALAGTRPNPWTGADLHALSRSPIQVADGMHWFRRKSHGGLAGEDTLRRAVNRWRYRGAAA